MKISVAMTTYKSTQFIKEQLESIFNQTLLPDELVICDDDSPDNTVEVTKEIIKSAPCGLEIKLFQNPSNLGHVRNFESCFTKCSGDLIFLCDSDDIWENEKIEKVLSVFENDDNVVMAFHDAIVIDRTGNVTSNSLNAGWDRRKDKNDSLELMLLNAKRQGIPYGFSIAFRKELLEQMLPFPKGYGHDEWIGLCAPLYGSVATIEDKLVRYRRHGKNTSNCRPSIQKRLLEWNRESWFTHAQDIKNVYVSYLERYQNIIPTQVRDELKCQVDFQSYLEKIINKRCWGGLGLIYYYFKGIYQKYRGTRNTLILDELYLIIHMFN